MVSNTALLSTNPGTRRDLTTAYATTSVHCPVCCAAATYLLAAPATGTPPHSVGGSVLVLRADRRDFALREYQRWWAFLSGTLLPLYVVRTVRPEQA